MSNYQIGKPKLAPVPTEEEVRRFFHSTHNGDKDLIAFRQRIPGEGPGFSSGYMRPRRPRSDD